jgi:hypothetical protein
VKTRALFVLPKPERVALLPEAGQSDAESLPDRGFDQTSKRSPGNPVNGDIAVKRKSRDRLVTTG